MGAFCVRPPSSVFMLIDKASFSAGIQLQWVSGGIATKTKEPCWNNEDTYPPTNLLITNLSCLQEMKKWEMELSL